MRKAKSKSIGKKSAARPVLATPKKAAPKVMAVREAGEAQARQGLIAIAQKMAASGLTPQRSGNVSVRQAQGFLITPSGKAYEALAAQDLVFVTLADGAASGDHAPSSEWPMHLAIYRARADLGAIVHTHSAYATSLACAGRDIPPFHYMVAVTGGDRIVCAPYATFGSDELARHVVKAMGQVRACLISNHGAVAAGASLEAAYELAWEVETLAAQYWRTLQIGVPRLIDRAEMTRVREKFRSFGLAAG